jgi:sugar phosphate isomerase/epimerase
MKKLGFCSISALDRSLGDAAALAKDAGLDGLEVTAHQPHLDPDDGVEAARAGGHAVRAAGVEVIAYGSYLGRFGQLERHHAEREAAIAAALATRLLRVWAEPIPEGSSAIAPVVDLVRAACDAARPAGITVVIERHLGSFADTPERIERLLNAVNRPNVALNYQVLDFLPPAAVGAQAADAAGLVRFARYFHLKNYQPNPDPDGPLFPGGSLARGVLDYRAILRAALAAGYDGPLTIEFLAADPRPVEDKLREDVAFVRRVLNEVGSGRQPAPSHHP